MSLLTIAQDLADEIGYPRPATVINNTDDGVRQILAILNRVGRDITRNFEWSAQFRDKSVTVTSGTDTYALPTDLSRVVDDTMWDTTNLWPMIGPLSTQEWEMIKRGVTITGPRRRWRIVGEADGTYTNPSANTRYVQIDPVPTNSSDTFYYSYVTKGFARQTTDTTAGIFDHDSDEPLMDEQIFVLGGKYRWLRAKGLDYAEEYAEFKDWRDRCMAQDKGARILSLNRRRLVGPQLLDWHNIPDTGYGA